MHLILKGSLYIAFKKMQLPVSSSLTSFLEREKREKMELSLEELLAPSWTTFPSGVLSELFFPAAITNNNGGWSYFDDNPDLPITTPNSSSLFDQNFESPLNEFNYPSFENITQPQQFNADEIPIPKFQDQCGELGVICGNFHCSEESNYKVEETDQTVSSSTTTITTMKTPVFNMGFCGERKSKAMKKAAGQPSKNLMAERRRRKRLNDRLSMLRSIVPKISKMDRTAILGDAIDYMKELLSKIQKFQEHEEDHEPDGGFHPINVRGNFIKELKPNELVLKNAPKFDVERREMDTRIEVCCAPKPGLLLSTVSTIEALGLDIQHCVISCFNDFSLQASCSEAIEQRAIISSEEIKQTLCRNSGYGGRCL